MIEFREARPQDDPQLTQLVSTPMPGALSLAFCREPSYLQSCQRCGPPRRVLTAVDGDRVLALCSFFLRSYQWGDGPRQVWTISDFRALPDAAGKSITGRGWRALRERLQGHPAIISVLSDNARALQLFEKSRPHWPSLRPVADLVTNLQPLFNFRHLANQLTPSAVPSPSSLQQSPNPQVRQLDAEEIASFVNSRAHGPRIEPSDFGGVLPRVDQFWGVFDRQRLRGLAGLSQPSAYRQIKVHAYRGVYHYLYKASRALGLTLLPQPGSEVPVSLASLLICPNPSHFRALFSTLKQQARLAGSKFLVWCRHGQEACRLLDRIRLRYSSSLYQLQWPGDPALPRLGENSFEVAWL